MMANIEACAEAVESKRRHTPRRRGLYNYNLGFTMAPRCSRKKFMELVSLIRGGVDAWIAEHPKLVASIDDKPLFLTDKALEAVAEAEAAEHGGCTCNGIVADQGHAAPTCYDEYGEPIGTGGLVGELPVFAPDKYSSDVV